MSKVSRLADLRKSARKVEPYVLDLGDGDTVKVDPPSTKAIFALGKVGNDPEALLKVLTGDSFEKLYGVLQDESLEVFNAVLSDMMEAFGMGNGEEEDPTSLR